MFGGFAPTIPGKRTFVSLTVDLRNVIVHNHGVINAVFKRRHPECSDAVGTPVVLTIPQMLHTIQGFIGWIMDLDVRGD
jgi:hypothetical protein